MHLCDKSIVSYVISHSNNNQLVFDTFNLAIAANPDAKPLSIVIEVFNIQAKFLKLNSIVLKQLKVCHVLADS
jgi:hypothetical protein